MLTVTTNNHIRPLVSWHDISENSRGWFDYLDDDARHDYRLVAYRGAYYDVFDMMRAPEPLSASGWHGYSSDTYFSGIVVRLNDDAESVVVGCYYEGDS
jgi:hypothetical protein